MARLIKIPEERKQSAIDTFAGFVRSRTLGGELNFKYELDKVDSKADLFITELAMLKMKHLVGEFDKEVGWYGCARRVTDAENPSTFVVDDILVYPQTVSGATVDFDPPAVAKWKMEHYDDERTHRMYLHGHSHVNMGTSPSPTDKEHQREILDMLNGDQFYIFTIMNKRGERYLVIYDMLTNTMYEQADIKVTVLKSPTGIFQFISDAKELVKNETPKTQTYPTYQGYPYYRGNSYGYPYQDDEDDEEGVYGVAGANRFQGAASFQAGANISGHANTGLVGTGNASKIDTGKKNRGKPKRASRFFRSPKTDAAV